jgi:uncharacterized protein (TIGR03067 family)
MSISRRRAKSLAETISELSKLGWNERRERPRSRRLRAPRAAPISAGLPTLDKRRRSGDNRMTMSTPRSGAVGNDAVAGGITSKRESFMKTLLSCGAVAFLAIAAMAGGDEAVKKDLKLLEGAWKIDYVEHADGKKEELNDASVTFKGEQLEFKKGNDTKKASIKINPAGKPKEIDIKPEGKEEAMVGIYKFEDAHLKICVTEEPNAARPNEFVAKDRWMLVVLKRAKE